MATVQISFQDNADNETAFKIYRGTSSTVSTTDVHILTMTWDAATSTWGIAQIPSSPDLNASIITGATTAPSETGNNFVVVYDEATPGTYYYGVAASNVVGDSGVASSAQSVDT